VERIQVFSGGTQQTAINIKNYVKGIYFYSLVAGGEIIETKKMNVSF